MKEKNKYGQYFTEPYVAEFMVSLISHNTSSQILEPSCGRGVFLDILKKYGYTNLEAYEIDTTLATNYNCVQHKSFLSAPLSEKYDVIIGNPPYIRWKNLEDELKQELSANLLWNTYFNSLCDYLYIFILKSIEQLSEGGELIFICSDYWMNTTNSLSLRNYMCQHGYFERIYHFKEAPLFEKVCASFVIFKYIKSSQSSSKEITLFSYNKKGQPTLKELQEGKCFDVRQIPQFVENQRWLLADKQTQTDLVTFEKICIKQKGLLEDILYRIGDVCDIANGMVSGLDAAFAVSEEEIPNLNKQEKKCLINVLKAKNLERYTYSSTIPYIYMPSGIEKEEFLESYPHFATHFQPYIEQLDKRYQYGKKIPYWEFAFPRSKSLFEKPVPKIFIPCKERISHKQYFRFCYSPVGFYPLQDVTGIVRKSTCQESVEYLLAYLNTDYVFQWLRFNGIVKGEIVEFSEAPIANIPYLRIDWTNPEEILIHEKITNEVKHLLDDNQPAHQDTINQLFKSLFYVKNRL